MAKGIPLLYITPEDGVRVFTERLQVSRTQVWDMTFPSFPNNLTVLLSLQLKSQVFKTMAWDLNPFQNPSIAHKTSIDNTSEPHLQQKLEELLDLEDDSMKQNLTPEEMARIAGGFGWVERENWIVKYVYLLNSRHLLHCRATDDSVAQLLNDAMQRDLMTDKGAESLDGAAHSLQGEKCIPSLDSILYRSYHFCWHKLRLRLG